MGPVRGRSVLLLLCFVALPAIGSAQPAARTLDELRLLVRAGDRVSVTDASGRVWSGPITLLSPTAVELAIDGQPRQWTEGDIATISQRRADSLGNGALWGLAVGAGFATTAVLITVAADHEDGYDHRDVGWATLAIGIYAAMGAGVGVGIDALVKKEQIIYRRGGASARWQVAPFLTPRARGVRMSIRF